jgi:hypothetical protein
MKKTQNKDFKLSSSGALRLLDLENRVPWVISDILGWSLTPMASW